MNLLIRFFANLFRNLLVRRPLGVLDCSHLMMRVLPNDLDLNFHMNNGRYLTIMDIGRMDLTTRIGLMHLMVRRKWGAVATSVNITFFRPLAPFAKYKLETKVLAWDDSWFYLEQQFIKNQKIYSHAVVKVAILEERKRISPKEVAQALAKGEIESPEFPSYLVELLEAEGKVIDEIKRRNENLKKVAKT